MPEKIGNILVVDDDLDVLRAARLLLRQHAILVQTENNPEQIPSLMKAASYDVIMLDMNFTRDLTSGQEGFRWLQTILEIAPESVVVLITAYGGVETAVQAIKAGATDFVLKPWQNEKLIATLTAAANLYHSRQEVNRLRCRQQQLVADLDQGFQDFIGISAAMQQVFATIQKVAGTDANVLILGENGTGKELVARALHRQSRRNGEVFIRVDMGALSETLHESELFGHVKGAFTDAREDRAGRIETASGGTLFLDEMGNLLLPLQSKLLTVLEQRHVCRLGSNKEIAVDIRLISATNQPLYDMVERKEFRQDLLYRINTVEIHLPPLRQRPEDIPLLVEHYLKQFNTRYRKGIRGITSPTLHKLEKYHWPGNVRELKHALERAVIMSEGEWLQPSDFFFGAKLPASAPGEAASLNLRDVEKAAICRALSKHQGNVSQAARELGLTRTSLYRRMHDYGLQ